MGFGEVVVLVAILALGVLVILRSSAGNQAERTRLSALDAQTEARSRTLDDRERILERREAAADERDRDLTAREGRLTQERTTLDEQRAALEENRRDHQESVRRERDEVRALAAALQVRDEALLKRSDRLDDKQSQLEQRQADLETQQRQLDLDRADHESRHVHLEEMLQEAERDRVRIAGLSAEEARGLVLERAEHEARLDAARLTRRIERDAHADADRRARRIITTAIQRLAAEQTADTVVTVVHLPSDEMKGRIIGREGRNIRAFEQVTGVTVMVDDTPETVLLSCFDPVRREAARVALEQLVSDGRIHPSHIEEAYERATRTVAERCLRAAEDAVAEVGITDLAPDLLPTLGALQYRTSYGQNVLRHLVECSHLAAMMATELGLDPAPARRAAFLHDIGKALTHEAEGPHALVGADLLRRHGEGEDIVHAVAAHHNEVEPETVEALLVQAADAISGSRPGARRESLEAHVRRLERLEQIALQHEGVDRAFAMQAGRELRVMVLPEQVDDVAAASMARVIAREIETELTYPGEVRVTVVRESRTTATAH